MTEKIKLTNLDKLTVEEVKEAVNALQKFVIYKTELENNDDISHGSGYMIAEEDELLLEYIEQNISTRFTVRS